MRIIATKDYASLSRVAADLVKNWVRETPDGLLSIPGGDSPAGLAEESCQRVRESRICKKIGAPKHWTKSKEAYKFVSPGK